MKTKGRYMRGINIFRITKEEGKRKRVNAPLAF
jgi:hypothetical protein